MPDGRLLASRLLTKESGWVTLPVAESAIRAQPSHSGATRLKYVGIVAAFATVAAAAWWLISRAVAG
jgi:predicted component of type VI protein secretion system